MSMSMDRETLRMQVQIAIAEIETVIHAHRQGNLNLDQLIVRLDKAVASLRQVATYLA